MRKDLLWLRLCITSILKKKDLKQQKFTEAIYHLTKSFDPYRPVITNDGWEHTVSDILTLHDYVETKEEFEKRYSNKDGTENKDADEQKCRRRLDISSTARLFPARPSPDIDRFKGSIR